MKLNIQLFASGTIPRNYAPSNGDIQIVWSSTSSGSVDNYSTVTASVQVKRRSSGETTGTFSGYIYINGQSQAVKKKFSPLKNEWKTVGTFTTTVNHNADGTKQIWIESDLEQTGTSLAGDYNANEYVTLDTISRISPVSTVSSADMNTTITIYTNRYTSFTHTIRYEFGSTSGTIATGVGDNTSWAIPINLANQIPNSVSGLCKIYCDTYNGSTYIGTSMCSLTLNVPSSVAPSVSFTMTKGGNTSLNAWVQNKSQAIINITASGSYGSSITSYSINGDGYTYNVNPTTTNTLRFTGNQTFYVTATDSRGRKATTTQTIYVEPYSMPTISTAQVQRCNQDGTLNDNGDYCYYVFNGSISSVNSLNKTNTTYKIGYKLSTDANYTYITIDSNKDSITSSGVLSSGGTEIQFNSSNTYDIQFTIEDTYSTSANTIQLTSGFDLMNFNASGKSMAIGMVSQRGANEKCLDIDLDTYIGGLRVGRIARVQLTSNDTKMVLSNLNLETGKSYRIVIAEYSVSGSGKHYIRINNISSNDTCNFIYTYTKNDLQSFTLSSVSAVGITNSNGFGTGSNIVFTELTMNYYDSNNIHLVGMSSGGKISSGTVRVEQTGSMVDEDITISSIGVYGTGAYMVGAGSYMEIWGL